ncbi:MAG: hypothetical protein ACOVQ2_05455 [Flavobacterium sp.]
MKKSILVIYIISFFFISCENEENQDIVQEVNKEGAIETIVSVKHIKNFDVLITTHKIWVNHQLYKTIVKKDTIPSLGNKNEEVKDENETLQKLTIPKDYEFYITVN